MKNVIIACVLTFMATFGFCQQVVHLENKNGVFFVPCTVNGLELNAIIDTTASGVFISSTEVDLMIKKGMIKKESDLIVTQKYNVINDEIAEGTKVIIRKLVIGDNIFYNTEASIDKKLTEPFLIGQSIIKKLGIISLDFKKNLLLLLQCLDKEFVED